MQTMYVRLKLILLIGMESFSIYYYYDTHRHARTTIDRRPLYMLLTALFVIHRFALILTASILHPPSH